MKVLNALLFVVGAVTVYAHCDDLKQKKCFKDTDCIWRVSEDSCEEAQKKCSDYPIDECIEVGCKLNKDESACIGHFCGPYYKPKCIQNPDCAWVKGEGCRQQSCSSLRPNKCENKKGCALKVTAADHARHTRVSACVEAPKCNDDKCDENPDCMQIVNKKGELKCTKICAFLSSKECIGSKQCVWDNAARVCKNVKVEGCGAYDNRKMLCTKDSACEWDDDSRECVDAPTCKSELPDDCDKKTYCMVEPANGLCAKKCTNLDSKKACKRRIDCTYDVSCEENTCDDENCFESGCFFKTAADGSQECVPRANCKLGNAAERCNAPYCVWQVENGEGTCLQSCATYSSMECPSTRCKVESSNCVAL